MGKHSAPRNNTRKVEIARNLAKHAAHPITHIGSLIALHVVASVIIYKTPILAVFITH